MDVTRRTLFESATLQIGLFEAHNVSERCGEIERQRRNVVVLPLSGVFSKHEAPSRHVICTPSHAVFIAADTPYRVGYPGAIGDQALILRFDDALAPDDLDGRDDKALASNGLLSGEAMILRNLLYLQLAKSRADKFEIEARSIDLLDMSFRALRPPDAAMRRAAGARWIRALEHVKEAVAVTPTEKWNVERLARVAELSPFYLCRVFRRMTGSSVYDYVLRERLASTLDAVLDGANLTMIALDAGFASHSHFTAHFHRFFGCTPTALRRRAKADKVAKLRKIVTARGAPSP